MADRVREHMGRANAADGEANMHAFLFERGWRPLLCFVAFGAGIVSSAGADSSASVIDVHPAVRSTLGRNENAWIRIEYATDEPISLWARPHLGGVSVTNAMSNASLTYTGSGEALGWFSLGEPGEVDEVRVFAGGGKPYREWELTRYGVQWSWQNVSSPRPRVQWVDDLLAVEDARRAEDARRRASEPTSAGDVALVSGFMLIVLGLVVAGLAVPLWSAWKWRGGWRIAAAAPAALMAFVVLRILVDTARDPTSHNLWPFEIVLFGAGAIAWIAALRVGRRIAGI